MQHKKLFLRVFLKNWLENNFLLIYYYFEPYFLRRVNVAVARALAQDYGLAGTESHHAGMPSSSSSLAPSPAVPSPAVPSITPTLNAAFSASTFHAFNVLLHAAVTAAYVGLLQGVGVSTWVCLGAGSLFAAHPVHVEAVAGVVGRAELLAAFAFCLALTAYTRYLRGRATGRAWGRRLGHECACLPEGQNGRYLPSVLFWGSKGRRVPQLPSWVWLGLSIAGAGVAMACKEQGVTALGVAVLLHAGAVVIITPRNKVRNRYIDK